MKKRGESRNTKTWMSQERKELFRWSKRHFSYLFKGYILCKKKNDGHKLEEEPWKIPDAMFKEIILLDAINYW